MTNKERLLMEISGIDLPDEDLNIYLSENGLRINDEYDTSSINNKKAIYMSALSILNSIANQPHLLKNYKQDDMSVLDFAKNLQNRIDQLQRTISQMTNEDASHSNYFNLFM